MKKLPTLRLIRDKRSYSLQELADVLGVHVRTAQSWHKSGMPHLEGPVSPLLFDGLEIKTFLRKKRLSKKTTLGPGECFCMACKKAVTPWYPEILETGRKIGKNKASTVLVGACPNCLSKVRRLGVRELDTS